MIAAFLEHFPHRQVEYFPIAEAAFLSRGHLVAARPDLAILLEQRSHGEGVILHAAPRFLAGALGNENRGCQRLNLTRGCRPIRRVGRDQEILDLLPPVKAQVVVGAAPHPPIVVNAIAPFVPAPGKRVSENPVPHPMLGSATRCDAVVFFLVEQLEIDRLRRPARNQRARHARSLRRAWGNRR